MIVVPEVVVPEAQEDRERSEGGRGENTLGQEKTSTTGGDGSVIEGRRLPTPFPTPSRSCADPLEDTGGLPGSSFTGPLCPYSGDGVPVSRSSTTVGVGVF